jgi:hypothetical protein
MTTATLLAAASQLNQRDKPLEFNADYTHFDVGGTVKQAGGTDVDFVMLSAAYRF